MDFNIGYWYISIDLLDYLDNTNGEYAEQFIWEATVTQDGYRCWYFESDSLVSTLDRAIAFANKYKYIMDTDV